MEEVGESRGSGEGRREREQLALRVEIEPQKRHQVAESRWRQTDGGICS